MGNVTCDRKHIVIVTGQHMTANPRVWKEANALFNSGYKVTVLSTFYDTTKLKEDEHLLSNGIIYKAAVNLIPGSKFVINRIIAKILRKTAIFGKCYLGRDSAHLVAYYPRKILKQALAENADLYIAHQETGLIIGCELIKHKLKVAFDIEDWYSRDYLNILRPVRLLNNAEAFAFKYGIYISCPSESMATALFETYRIERKPNVIYNGFSVKENNVFPFEKRQPRSIVWFSQVIGQGRGLEILFDAMQYIDEPLELNLIGKVADGYEKIIKKKLLNTRHRVLFHGVVKHRDLIPLLSKFIIGLALETNETSSRDTTITNKILQYLQAGNKIIATKTQGQTELSKKLPGLVHLVDINQPKEWAKTITFLINNSENNIRKQLNEFSNRFSWEAQEVKLLSLVSNALKDS